MLGQPKIGGDFSPQACLINISSKAQELDKAG